MTGKTGLNQFISDLQSSIASWDYFSDFLKVHENAFKIKIQLNILNSLLGEKNVKEKFIKIISEYPETREALLILIATRIEKIKDMPILNPLTLTMENKSHLFNKKIPLDDGIKNDLWLFFKDTGLVDIFQSKKVNSLEDYVFGVEVGLDSNARKNRTGDLMEKRVEIFVSNFCKQRNYEYTAQATKTKILQNYGIKIKIGGDDNKKGERKFDFAIFERKNNKLTIIEVNYYSATGSKPSSIAREYIDLEKNLEKENIRFIWVTDGLGWVSMKNPLEKTINENKYVLNLKMLKDGILDAIFND